MQYTSGIPCYIREWTTTEAEDEIEIPGSLHRHLRSDYLVSRYMSGDLQFDPGSRYHYSSSNHYLLGKIIERVTGKSFEHNLKERIIQPLGLCNTGLGDFEKIVPYMSSGYVNMPTEDAKAPFFYYPNFYGTGGMYSTVEDLYRWNRALETDRLIPKDLHAKLFTPYWKRGVAHSYLFNHFTLRLSDNDPPITYTSFSGTFDGFTVDVFRFPETGHIIVMFDNSRQHNQWEIIPDIYRIMNHAPYTNPIKLVSKYISRIALDRGPEAASNEYERIKENKVSEYEFRNLEEEIDNYTTKYAKLQRLNDAEILCELNTKFFPSSPEAWTSLGRILARNGKEDLSQNAFDRSKKLKGVEGELINMIAGKKYDEADEKINQIRKASPDRVACDRYALPSTGLDSIVNSEGAEHLT